VLLVEYWLQQSTGKGKITPGRIERLEEIGFEWDPQKAQWGTMYEKLKAFVDEHGHARVPKGYAKDPELANWVRNQRLEYVNLQKGKKSRINEERVEKLNALNFKWSAVAPTKLKDPPPSSVSAKPPPAAGASKREAKREARETDVSTEHMLITESAASSANAASAHKSGARARQDARQGKRSRVLSLEIESSTNTTDASKSSTKKGAQGASKKQSDN
jgi:hypothetical protein